MNKIHSLVFLILAFVSTNLWANGPWLVYTSTISGEGAILPLNLGYQTGPQYALRETDPDEEHNINFNPRAKTIWKTIYDGNNNDDASIQNEWHRLSWGRQGKTFGLLYSQYEVLGPDGTQDHGVFFGTGTCVSWPNRGKSIGVTGLYPPTINIRMLRLDGNWVGSALTNGSRQLKQWNFTAKLDVALTKALNDARTTDGITTNLQAKEWIIDYFVERLGYRSLPDVSEY